MVAHNADGGWLDSTAAALSRLDQRPKTKIGPGRPSLALYVTIPGRRRAPGPGGRAGNSEVLPTHHEERNAYILPIATVLHAHGHDELQNADRLKNGKAM
jgi:hypothetical protein